MRSSELKTNTHRYIHPLCLLASLWLMYSIWLSEASKHKQFHSQTPANDTKGKMCLFKDDDVRNITIVGHSKFHLKASAEALNVHLMKFGTALIDKAPASTH